MDDIRQRLLASFPELKTFSHAASREGIGFYIVGGAIRDLLIGTDPKDVDFVPERRDCARAMAELFVRFVGGALVEFQSHGDIFRVVFKTRIFDFTELQGEDIEADLKRRDFTINAMALCLDDAVSCDTPLHIIDPLDGRKDIENKIIRLCRPGTFDDDPLRIMRLFRFAFKLGFEMDGFSYRLIPQKMELLKRVSPERIRDELMELMHIDSSASALEAMEGVGLLTFLFPAMESMKGFPQNDFHHLDVYSHTIAAISELEKPSLFESPRLAPFKERAMEHIHTKFNTGRSRLGLMKLALLFHDLGKPASASYDETGRLHFIGHEKISDTVAREYLNWLRLSRREISFVLGLIKGHMRPGQISPDSKNLHRQVYRYFREFGADGIDLAILSIADRLAARGPAVSDEMVDNEYAICAELLDTFFNRSQLIARPEKFISGRQLIDDLGVAPGPRVGILLDRIEEAQVDGRVTDFDSAVAYAKQLISRFESEGESTPPN